MNYDGKIPQQAQPGVRSPGDLQQQKDHGQTVGIQQAPPPEFFYSEAAAAAAAAAGMGSPTLGPHQMRYEDYNFMAYSTQGGQIPGNMTESMMQSLTHSYGEGVNGFAPMGLEGDPSLPPPHMGHPSLQMSYGGYPQMLAMQAPPQRPPPHLMGMPPMIPGMPGMLSQMGGPPQPGAALGAAHGSRAIYLGNVHPDVPTSDICALTSAYGPLESVSRLHDKNSAFVNYVSSQAAIAFFNDFSGPGREPIMHNQKLRIGWAKSTELRDDLAAAIHRGATRNLYVRLSSDVNDEVLRSQFHGFGEIESVKVYPEKSYAFVNFLSISSALKAKNAMNGVELNGGPITINFAKDVGNKSLRRTNHPLLGPQFHSVRMHDRKPNFDPQAPTASLWIGDIDMGIEESQLRQKFQPYGEILSLSYLPTRQCAFINFSEVSDAQSAREALQGTTLGNTKLRINYAKPPKSNPAHHHHHQQQQQQQQSPQQAPNPQSPVVEGQPSTMSPSAVAPIAES
eukprot:GFYU01002155.1.p1 GENE.GFYU01002155.1~~GFYU01002155.1.p1  ORF type:complete len:509 (+),score=69.62 GFYU01002155.1:125-1651(+)